MKINSCSLGLGPCPTEFVNIDVNLVDYASGLRTYIVCYDPANPTGCIYEYQIGSINYGDTIPVNLIKHDFGFYNSTCLTSFCKIAIIVVGKPTTFGQNYYCKTEIFRSSAYIVDGCANYCQENIYCSGSKNCSITGCVTTSIKESTNNNISFYPNPANDKIHIQLDDSILQNGIVSIYNDLGEIVIFKKSISVSTDIDISKLENGIYFISFDNGTKTVRQKFIKNGK